MSPVKLFPATKTFGISRQWHVLTFAHQYAHVALRLGDIGPFQQAQKGSRRAPHHRICRFHGICGKLGIHVWAAVAQYVQKWLSLCCSIHPTGVQANPDIRRIHHDVIPADQRASLVVPLLVECHTAVLRREAPAELVPLHQGKVVCVLHGRQ